MQLLEDSLSGLVKSGAVSVEEARRYLTPKYGSSADGADGHAAAPPAARPDPRRASEAAGPTPTGETARAAGGATPQAGR
jgi:hypothetical protein